MPSGEQKRLLERFYLSEDGKRALIDVLLEDPEYLAEPFGGQTTLVYSPHLELYSYDCNP